MKLHLPALGLGVEHGDADDLRRERPQAHEFRNLLALGGFGGGVGEFFGLAEKVFLLRLVEIFERQRGGFDVENECGHLPELNHQVTKNHRSSKTLVPLCLGPG